jgi:MinD superfamily P-loop ATPase
MRVAIASGKGGTGKTLVSTNLSRLLADRGHRVTYVDADVEAPNGHLFLTPTDLDTTQVTVALPVLKEKSCAAHGRCQEICAFNAILAAKGSIIVFEELCHSCGACILACPDNSLKERQREIGTLELGKATNMCFASGKLNVGEARSAPLISAVLQRVALDAGDDVMVVDAPPGVACSAVEAVKGSDLALLVTEPTPFGLHDLGLAVEMCRALGVETAAVVNRADLGHRKLNDLLDAAHVPIITEIPFEKSIASAYADAKLAMEYSQSLRNALGAIADYIENRFGGL